MTSFRQGIGSTRPLRQGLIAILLFVGAFLGVARAESARCTRVHLGAPRPLAINSTVYVESLGKIAVVDRLRNNLMLIDPNGETQLYDPKRLVESAENMVPLYLNALDQGFALSMIDGRWLRLDRDLKKVEVVDLTKGDARGSIVSTYDSVSAGKGVFSFGAIQAPDGQIHIGFFRAWSETPSRPELLRDVAETDYYLLGHHYLTALDGDQYALLMSANKPVVLRFARDGTSQSLDIPERYRRAPELKHMATGPGSEAAMYKEVESLTIPVGLFGQDGFLYLLTREPGPDGRTRWNLFRIDPKRRQATRGMVLPTTANHLKILNTNRNWYIFEEGSVHGLGQQEIASMLIIPNDAIQSLALPAACRTVD
jgi:hypothetical protein